VSVLIEYLLAGLLSSSTIVGVCKDIEAPNEMYNQYFNIAYKYEVIDGNTSYITRELTSAQAEEAWSCILKASQLKNCSAVRIQELFYKHGVGKAQFGIEKDLQKAEYYSDLVDEYCKTKQ
jgi:hypothetical protein